MEWMIPVAPDERARGELHPETAEKATAAFRKHGCIVLRGAFSAELIDDMQREYFARYGSINAKAMEELSTRPPPSRLLRVGQDRYDITLRMDGAFGRPEVFANPLLRKFLMPLLGEDMRLNSFTSVVSYPGAQLQHIHRDHKYLFAEPKIDNNLPVYAVNVAVPLIDVDLETGPTGLWPGSHVWPSETDIPAADTITAFPLQRGDCTLLDYRTLHTGLPNRGRRVRPIIYMVYSRTWFFDEINHPMRTALDFSVEDYHKLPESLRPLMYRAFVEAMRNRWQNVDAQQGAVGSSDPESWKGKVGRNEPCPCGSGKRYKHCHGQLASVS